MDQSLFGEIYKRTPKFNPKVAGNICRDTMDDVENVITESFIASQKDYPDRLRFIKIERVDPKTEFDNGSWTKEEHDISKNTIYMVRIHFEFDGKPLKPFYLYLPYCYKGGLMVIGGATFCLNAVLIDPGLSITGSSIFLHVNRDKLTFLSSTHSYFEGKQRVNRGLVHSQIYRGGKKPKGSTFNGHRSKNMHSSLAHYIFATYGFSGAFERYLGVPTSDIVIGTDEIDEVNYPPDVWTICTSIGQKPHQMVGKFYTPTDVSVAIKTKHLNADTRAYLVALFYLADFFPEQFKGDDLDSPAFYKKLLALTILPFQQELLTAIRDTQRHLFSLDSHIDEHTRITLDFVHGIKVHNLYDLFANIISTYHQRATCTVDSLTSMYDKRLVLLRYLLFDITKKIYNLGFELQSSKSDETFTAEKAERKIDNHIKPLTIIGINNAKHREITGVQVSTDNMIAKVSSPIVPQSEMSSDSSNRTKVGIDMLLSASIAEVGNITSIAGDATGRHRLNMFVNVAEDGTIVRNPELVECVDRAQAAIRR